MKKKTPIVALCALSLCLAAGVAAGCAPKADSGQAGSTGGADASQSATTIASDELIRLSDVDYLNMTPEDFEKWCNDVVAQNHAMAAPSQTTLDDGTVIQKVPDDTGVFNTYVLDAENRGCYACHDNLNEQVMNMPMSMYGQPLSHMNVSGIQDDCDIVACIGCHDESFSAPSVGNMIHAIHAKEDTDTTCVSCHVYGEEGKFTLWDYDRYSQLQGIKALDASAQEFTYDQDVLTPYEDIFNVQWVHTTFDFARFLDQEGSDQFTYDMDELLNWPITFKGAVEEEVTFTIGELIDMGYEESRIAAFVCHENGTTGGLASNVKMTGISVKKIINDLVPYTEDAGSAYVFLDTWYPYTVEQDIDGDTECYLVYKMNDEYLDMRLGWPVTTFYPGMNANNALKHPTSFQLLPSDVPTTTVIAINDGDLNAAQQVYLDSHVGYNRDSSDADYAGVEQMKNSPFIACLNTQDGQVIEPGKYTFEGYAYGHEGAITQIQFSLDRGKSWVTYDIETPDRTRWVYWYYTVDFPDVETAYTLYARSITEQGYVSPWEERLLVNVR